MRNNQPVIDEEYIVPEGSTLVSKTDLVGNITECNEAFELASGYTRKQLIGQPHNLIRHPDIPEAVFKDLWETLAIGAPWSQIVKNRRANGGFYWVIARATPIYENGKLSGYMSVRSPALDAHKQAATQIYKDINSGKARIKNARIIYGTDWQALKFFPRLNPQSQLMAIIGLFYLIPAMAYGYQTGLNSVAIALIGLLGLIPAYIYGSMRQKAMLKACSMLHTIASQEEIVTGWYDPTSFNGKLKSAITATGLATLEVREEAANERDQANRLQSAIDNVQSNIMIADMDHKIIYTNQTMQDFFAEREQQLKTILPSFDKNTLLGSDINQFHQNQHHMSTTLERVANSEELEMKIAGYHIILHITPVLNRTGTQMATLIEWEDQTAQMQLMVQVNSTVKAAQHGELDTRIDLSLVEGVAKELSLSLNNLLDTISQPINEVVKVAIALSQGDLSKAVEGDLHGRFAVMQDSLNVAIDNLACIISENKLTASAVQKDAIKIQNGSLKLNERTQAEAASLEQTAASMEEITASVKQNADNAAATIKTTQDTVNEAQAGVDVMHNAINSMEEINASSKQVSDIIGLIDSIAFQTNLLALNAAVEAARAGEHGKGFAVVAGEVRNLAGRSADAAKDIRSLIEDTVKKVSEGTQHVQGSGDALNQIVEAITEVSHVVEAIAHSSTEQSQGVDQVNAAMSQIDTSIQQNSILAEETSILAEELRKMSTMMNDNMGQFSVKKIISESSKLRKMDDFDFALSRRNLRQWRIIVRSYLNDIEIKFDRAAAGNKDVCALGQWLNTVGRDHNTAAINNLTTEHAEFHNFVSEILQLKDAGDVELATEMMGRLAKISDRMSTLIDQVETEYKTLNKQVSPRVKPIEMTTATKKPTHTNKPKKAIAKPLQKPVVQNTPEEWADF